MAYYIRVLGTELDVPALEELREKAVPALIENITPETGRWTELALKHASGEEIAIIERSETSDGLGADELAEFHEEVMEYEPANAAGWLQSYLPKVKVIYAFQVLSGTEVQDGWEKLHAVYNFIWNKAKGILQADGEGFSNEDGDTILWQFGPGVDGEWNVAVLEAHGLWTRFEMQLGDKNQRDAFKRGEVPPGVALATEK